MNNVINMDRSMVPVDLLDIQSMARKLDTTYSYLYKWSVVMGEIPIYCRGKLKLSERDVIDFL